MNKFIISISLLLRKAFYLIEQLISNWLTGAIIVGLIGAMCLEVTLRWVFERSLIGLPEIVEMLVVIITFTSLAVAQRNESHIKMSVLLEMLEGKRASFILSFINSIISIALFLFLALLLARYTIVAYEAGHKTMNIFIPRWPSYLLATLGSFIMTGRLAMQAKKQLLQILKKS
jgi:TRAP-type C4-dicarboxylate transport system permease small subunit